MQNLILIKLGGSTITDKTKRKAANIKVINRLAREIAQAHQKTKDLLLIGHGQGSFAHVPAKKYKTIEGNIAKNSAYGAALVRQECIELNKIILESLVKAQLPAVTFEPHNFLLSSNKKIKSIYIDPVKNGLKSGLLPVVYGDVIVDEKIGWTIFSGEQILNAIALKLKTTFKPKLIIEVGKTAGVYDDKGKTITEINSKNYKEIEKNLKGSHGADVTGGMVHKVTEAYQIAQKGVPTLLISAKPGNLTKAILGNTKTGTLIS